MTSVQRTEDGFCSTMNLCSSCVLNLNCIIYRYTPYENKQNLTSCSARYNRDKSEQRSIQFYNESFFFVVRRSK